jgi:hypothetical protein
MGCHLVSRTFDRTGTTEHEDFPLGTFAQGSDLSFQKLGLIYILKSPPGSNDDKEKSPQPDGPYTTNAKY